MGDFWTTLLSPSSGPLWGLLGVVATQVANILINRKRADTDGTGAALAAVNVAHKQLVDSLFQQVKVLTEQVEVLRTHTEECERQHREALARLSKLERASDLTG